MRLEAVTVCIGYGDFLAASAPWNAHQFDKWTVVTAPDDRETRDVCRRFGIHCVLSHEHLRHGAKFNKGRLVERGLHHCSAGAWRVHIDADVVLPARLRHYLDHAHLDESCIHGADRIMVRSWEQWLKLQASGWLVGTTRRYPYSVELPDGFSIGARWSSPEAGFTPIGFFQLWHAQEDEYHGARVKPYPQHHGTACRSDVQHSLQWDRRKRVLIPELFVVHLESESAKNGTNWNGRKTKRFGPSGKAMSPLRGPS